MESGMGAGASGHGMRPVGGCWAPVGLETTPRRERRRVPESRCRGPHRDGIPRAACGQYAHGIAVADAGRLARGLDQLLESLAHADQLDLLDVEGVLALRSISERCAERIGDAARILEAQNEILYVEERTV